MTNQTPTKPSINPLPTNMSHRNNMTTPGQPPENPKMRREIQERLQANHALPGFFKVSDYKDMAENASPEVVAAFERMFISERNEEANAIVGKIFTSYLKELEKKYVNLINAALDTLKELLENPETLSEMSKNPDKMTYFRNLADLLETSRPSPHFEEATRVIALFRTRLEESMNRKQEEKENEDIT